MVTEDEDRGKIMTIEEALIEKGMKLNNEAVFERGMEKGKEEGLMLGQERGREEEVRQIALKMLRIGQPEEFISEMTGLTIKEINKLKYTIN